MKRFFIIAMLLVGVGCGKDDADPKQPTAVRVRTVKVASQTFRETVEGIGSLEADRTIEVSPEIGGRVVELAFEDGQTVDKGDLLVRLDDSKLVEQKQAAHDARKRTGAQLQLARKDLDRFEKLFKGNAISQDRLDQARAAVKQLQAEADRLDDRVQLVDQRIDDTRVKAPEAGKLGQRLVEVGDFVKPGQAVVMLVAADPLEVTFTVPEQYAPRLAKGKPVEARVDAHPDQSFTGELTYIAPTVDRGSRQLRLKARIDNNPTRLTPGSFARVTVVLDVRTDRPSVPENALVAGRQGYSVFVVTDGKARHRNVEPGLRQVGRVEIREGLEVGETVITEGSMAVSDGQTVEPTDDQDDASPDDEGDDAS